MHFVTEEHGNSAHGHAHDHAHHDHEHHHSHEGADAMKETVALVGYITRAQQGSCERAGGTGR